MAASWGAQRVPLHDDEVQPLSLITAIGSANEQPY
jgi:hypothetical protein